jgi:hypothetical protein
VADWSTIASLATAGGTLVLATATFSAVRSANRAARVAERALLIGTRPIIMASRREDPPQKINWVDQHWARLDGGRASVELVDGNIYLALSLRNVGAGIAVLQSWHASVKPADDHALPDLDTFRRQSRDLYVPGRDVSFWQAGLRDPGDPFYAPIRRAIEQREVITIHLLYTDHEGGQRTITRLSATPTDWGEGEWVATTNIYYSLDRADPRRDDE